MGAALVVTSVVTLLM